MNPGQGRGLKGQSTPLRKLGELVLAWGMRNISSMITNRREVTTHAQPGIYSPESARLIRLHLAAADGWALLSSMRLVFEIHNTHATLPLEFIVPTPMGLYSQTRLISQGSVLETLDFHSRLSVLLNQTLPKEARELNGHEHLGVRVAKDSNVGRRYQHDEFGRIHGACWDAANGVYPREAAVDENRTISIPPNSKKIVSCTPIGGIWDSNMCWPLSAASLTYELTIESAMDQILAGATPQHGTAGGILGTGYGRSQQFQILLPRMEYSQVHLSSQAQSEYDSLLASTGLNMSLNSYHTMVANVVDRSPRCSFSRSLAKWA